MYSKQVWLFLSLGIGVLLYGYMHTWNLPMYHGNYPGWASGATGLPRDSFQLEKLVPLVLSQSRAPVTCVMIGMLPQAVFVPIEDASFGTSAHNFDRGKI